MMQNILNQILGTNIRSWADVIKSSFFLRKLSQTSTKATIWGWKMYAIDLWENVTPILWLRTNSPLFYKWEERVFWLEARERVKKKKRKSFFIQLGIILRENIVWICYSNCYSILFCKRTTIAIIKQI